MVQSFATPGYVSNFSGAKQPRLLSASRIDSNAAIHPRILHKHDDFFELLFVRSGSASYIIDEQRYPIKKGDLILCNAGVFHDEDPASSVDLNMLSVAIADLHISGLPVNHLIASQYAPVFSAGDSAELIDFLLMSIFNLLAETPDSSAETCHHMTAALLSSILTVIQKHYHVDSSDTLKKSNLVAAQVKEYINEHYSEDFFLEDIANSLHLSLYYLSHVFKAHTGYSPKQYLLRRRLGEAQTLLITTELSITDISAAVGYGNPNHFDRMFSKYIGMSPSGYRSFYVSKGVDETLGNLALAQKTERACAKTP